VKLSNKFKNWYRAAAVAMLNGVLLFLLLNLLLYLVGLAKRPPKEAPGPIGRYGEDTILKAYPGWRREDVKTLLRETYEDLTFEYEPFTEFRNKPLRRKFVNVDPAGFRFSKDQAPWPPRPQAMNVFLFGGSNTFGYGLPDDQTMASYLGECGLAKNSRHRLAVYNFGQAGYISSQELILFQQLLKAGFVPQVAVFMDGMDDFFFADGQPQFTERFRRLMEGNPDSSHSSWLDNVPMVKAAHWLSQFIRKPQPPRKTQGAGPALMEGVIARWLANKRMIETVADGFGVRPIFVWQPAPIYKYDLRYHFPSNGSTVIAGYHPVLYGYALMENPRAQGQLGRSDVLWLADMQQDEHQNLYVDATHYNATLTREIAAHICGFLNEHLKVR
jgi:hypothetical protein